jgi:hypothetical protein
VGTHGAAIGAKPTLNIGNPSSVTRRFLAWLVGKMIGRAAGDMKGQKPIGPNTKF